MSGLCGVFFRNGRSLPSSLLTQMAATLSHRGGDGPGRWQHENVGLGQLLRRTTPESLRETLPLVSDDGQRVLVADARIDNRADLMRELALPDRLAAPLPDSALIMAAYEKWGTGCARHLIGAFAFALWDGRRHTLLCARDHIGLRPLYYHLSSSHFVFASEIKALHCLPEVPRRLHELQVGFHLSVHVGDNACTFYRDIYRLRPAHLLTVTPDEVVQNRYWSLDPGREIRLPSDEAYAEAFRELFGEAVRCRMRAAVPVGTMLSGGLDSSAITCAARVHRHPEPLHTISAVYDAVPECNEDPYIAAVLATGNYQSHRVQMDRVNPLVDYRQIQQLGDEPIMSPTFYIAWKLVQHAAQQGVGVLLDGVDGDTAVSHGNDYLIRLVRSGRWDHFAHETQARAQHESMPTVAQDIHAYALPYLRELARSGRWLAFAQAARGLATRMDLSQIYLWRNHGLRAALPPAVLQWWRKSRGKEEPEQPFTPVRDSFARRVGLAAEMQMPELPPPETGRADHYAALTSNLLPSAFELTDRAGVAYGVEMRHPFADRRLLEFCLALPPAQKLQDGWIRIVLRRALAGTVPKPVLWRGGKTRNSAAFTYSFKTYARENISDLTGIAAAHLRPYLDPVALQQVIRRYLAAPRRRDEMIIWQALTLGLWLAETEISP